MGNEQKWLMIDMHTHSHFSRIRKTGDKDKVKEMSAKEYVDTLYNYGVRVFSVTDHNYFSDTYYNEIDKYIKNLDIRLINGTELDVYVTKEDGAKDYIHVCFYFEDSVNRELLHTAIDNLYSDDKQPEFNTILRELSNLNCKFIAIPHGDKDKRGILTHQLISRLSSDQKTDFYKYAMYKVFNAFDIKPGSFGDSENHWALTFYSNSDSFKKIVDGKTDEEIQSICDNIVEKLKDNSQKLNDVETVIYEYIKKYSSYYAYFSFSDWHNNSPYSPTVNNFIYGSLDYVFDSFELATLDPSSRIQQSNEKEIIIQDTIIEKVTFKIDGVEKNVSFAPGLNAIVGKRGSGKSLLISVINALADGNGKDSAISKYSNFSITNISGKNRKGIPISVGKLSSVVFLKQNDIREIIDNPQTANNVIANKFPPIAEIDSKNIKEIVELCNQIKPINSKYKSLTAEMSSARIHQNFSITKYNPVNFSTVSSEFENIKTSLDNIVSVINEIGFNSSDLLELYKAVSKTKELYIKKLSLLNSIIQKHNNGVEEINSKLSTNEKSIKNNRLSIKNAIQIAKDNFSILLAKKKLLYLLSTFKLSNPPAEVSVEGRYLFATFYDTSVDVRDLVQQKILSAITRSGDNIKAINEYVKGNDNNRLKVGYQSIGDDLAKMISDGTLQPSKKFYEILDRSIDYKNTIKSSKDLINYADKKYISDLSKASMGTRSVAYLNILFNLEENILVFDQPEDNIDNDYISNNLVPIIKENKRIKQLIFVTHNPSVAVYGDAFNYVYATNDGENINYQNYFIERKEDKVKLMNILEGGRPSFSNRNKKYGDVIGEEQYASN